MGMPRAVALSLAALVGLGGDSSVYGDDDRQVVVIVDDRASVRPLVMDQAQKQASRIYNQAGVKLVWRAAADPTDAADGRVKLMAGFTVRAVIHARFRGAVDSASTLMMGAAPATALKCGGPVHLFFDQISAYASRTWHDTALVFGTVAAHEIGHVLLRGGGHGEEGVMRASWKPDDWERAAAGYLVFAPRERETVRRRIAGCRDRD